MPWRWDEQGILLRADPFNRSDGDPAWYRWPAPLTASPAEPPVLEAPDGSATLQADTIAGMDPYLARWVGPHHVLWVGEGAMVRDLSAGSDRPLHVLGGVTGLDIDTANSRIALVTETEVRWAPTTR